jgi:hypothetical protein
MSTPHSSQTMKPATAAKKLGVYLPATPPEFQEGTITRGQLEELEKNPPEWLAELRRNGPHPRPVVAGRLNVSIAGLARGGVEEALTTEQINELREDPPTWLVRERDVQAKVREEEERLKARDLQKAKKAARAQRSAEQKASSGD